MNLDENNQNQGGTVGVTPSTIPTDGAPDQSSTPVPTSTPPVNAAGIVDPLLTEKTFTEDLDERWRSWKCLVCEYVYEGNTPKNVCPRCGNADPDKFDDTN